MAIMTHERGAEIERPDTTTSNPRPEAAPTPPKRHRGRVIGAIASAVVIVGAIVAFVAGSSGSSVPAGAAVERVRQGDQGLSLSASTVRAGKVAFEITNQGSIGHELVIFATSRPANALPMKDGDVNEESAVLRNVLDTGGNISVGHTRTIVVRLPAGHYVVICNLPGHYRLGMHADLTVR